MDRLTTDNPNGNFETILNMVYTKDGWGYIRHDGEGVKITDFCLALCKAKECNVEEAETRREEYKDEFLFECAFVGCPIATVYAALCGYCHTRSRLKKYEDAGMWPPQGHPALQKPLTLEELEALITAGEDVAVYCEAKGDPHAYATIFCNGKTVDPFGDMIDACDLVFVRYGISWRAWASRPTDEERAAAQWEDAGDADL